MPPITARHYMNPAYGRAMSQADGDPTDPDDSSSAAEDAAQHGNLKHLTVNIQREGGFSVHAHYQHPRAGHHTIESKHAAAKEAAEEIERHLRGHESRGAARS